jgi:hypothetical protein
MKWKIGMMVALMLALSTAIYAQAANNAYSAVIREAQNYVNGCGPENMQWAVPALNFISGNVGACNTHDLDYMTLGMSKSEADDRLYNALKLGSWTSVPVVAATFRAFLLDSAYRNAQNQARQEFRRIHHGNDWNSGYGRWKPSDGHIRVSFPQCTQSCSYY